VVGQPTAEQIKLDVGSAAPLDGELVTEVRGRDPVSGLPKTVELGSEEVRGALEETLRRIVAAVRAALEVTPPELASDIARRGILLAGGGTLLRAFDVRLREETGMPTYLADSPLTCVALGAGRVLDDPAALERARPIRRPRPGRRRRSARTAIS
jgi:rod shape-determining protein MreB